MNREDLRAKHPDLFQSVLDEGKISGKDEYFEQGRQAGLADGEKAGAEKERQRIKDVRAQLLPGHEALIEQMASDGKTTGAEAAKEVLAAEKKRIEEMAAMIASSAVQPVPPVTEPAGKSEETFEAAVDRLMAEGMSRGKAISKAAQEHPDLHRDYIARANQRAE